MCGIGGIITARPELELRDRLKAMQTALRHRGPDDEGLAEVQVSPRYRLGLVQTRLSILDLSAAGHQPMHDPASGSWIVYNGEVYNHLAIRQQLADPNFRSTSDTETILKSWIERGASTLQHLRGMFAFAVWDANRGELWLVRDRLGVKPLYACQVDDSTWVFASEVRALLATGLVPRKLNSRAVSAYLAYGAVPAPWTICERVESLLPAETWRFSGLGNLPLRSADETSAGPQLQKSKYWTPPFVSAARWQDKKISRQEAVEELKPALLEAVSLRMLADVPVGVFLSGGIDSSAIVAALSFQGYELQTFSVVFGEREFDESSQARLVAERFGSEHMELLIRPEAVLNQFIPAMAAYDQPSIDGLNTYFISQATRHAGVKVALSGLGGDELFAGYPYFRWAGRFEHRLSRMAAQISVRALNWLQPSHTRTTKLKAALQPGLSRLGRYLNFREVMACSRIATVYPSATVSNVCPSVEQTTAPHWLPGCVAAELSAASRDLDPVDAHSHFELSLYLANMLLRDTDQMSMAHALEVREPLLDHVLVETVARIPGPLKVTRGLENATKSLLVDALPSRLPRQILQRRKMGFVFPWERWLRNELRPQVTESLEDTAALRAVGLDADGVHSLWNGFLDRRPGLRYTDVLCLMHLLHWTQGNDMSAGNDCAIQAAKSLTS